MTTPLEITASNAKAPITNNAMNATTTPMAIAIKPFILVAFIYIPLPIV